MTTPARAAARGARRRRAWTSCACPKSTPGRLDGELANVLNAQLERGDGGDVGVRKSDDDDDDDDDDRARARRTRCGCC